MATGQAAFLELGDGYGATYARWQSYCIYLKPDRKL
jgi:hypothetical protein